MTSPTDIVGLVKELQERPNRIAILEHFPSLAHHFLDLVETVTFFSECQAEDNFKGWKDKVDNVQTWQEQFLNEVIMKPLNERAKEALTRLRSP